MNFQIKTISVYTRFFMGLLVMMFISCEYSNKHLANNSMPSKQLVLTADLKNDSATIAQYEYYHNAKNLWPEINMAAKNAGYISIAIYRFNNHLVMVEEFPLGADKHKMDSIYNMASPKLKQWGQIMSKLLLAPKGAKEGEIWVPMHDVYKYIRQ